jgi:hypothetical protein
MAALDKTRVPSKGADWRSLTLASAAALSADDVLGRLKARPNVSRVKPRLT